MYHMSTYTEQNENKKWMPPPFPPDLHMNETDMRQSRCTKPPYLGLPPIQYILHFVFTGGVGWVRRSNMDEGTIKTNHPRMSSLLVFLFGVVYQFCRFWIWSEKQSVKLPQNVVYNTTQHPSTPPPPTATRLLWEGGEGWGRSKRR
jgi:hypothetical protein